MSLGDWLQNLDSASLTTITVNVKICRCSGALLIRISQSYKRLAKSSGEQTFSQMRQRLRAGPRLKTLSEEERTAGGE